MHGELFIDGLEQDERRRVMRLIGDQLVARPSAGAGQRSDRR
jgi:hypothetical protein